eukprot:gene23800-25344_t
MPAELQVGVTVFGMGQLAATLEGVKYPSVWHALAASKTNNYDARGKVRRGENAKKAWMLSKNKSVFSDFDKSWDTRKLCILKTLVEGA